MTYSEFKKMAQQTKDQAKANASPMPSVQDVMKSTDTGKEIYNTMEGLGKAFAPFKNFSLKSPSAPTQGTQPKQQPQQQAGQNQADPQGQQNVEVIDKTDNNGNPVHIEKGPAGTVGTGASGSNSSNPAAQQSPGVTPSQTAASNNGQNADQTQQGQQSQQTGNPSAGQPAQGQPQPQQELTPEQRQQYEQQIAAFENYLKNNPEVANAGIESNPSRHLDLGANGADDMAGYKTNVTRGMGAAIFADANRATILDNSLKAAATVNGEFDQNKYTELKARAYQLMMGAFNTKDPKVQDAIYSELTQMLGKSNVLSSYLADENNWNMFIGKIEESDPMFTRWMIDMQNSFDNGTSKNADANSLKPFWDSLGPERQKQLVEACKKSMWHNLKADPLKNLPTIISLWLRNKGWNGMADYAEDPLKFYLTAIGTLAGGALLLGGGAAAASSAMGHPIINVGGSSNPYYNNEI